MNEVEKLQVEFDRMKQNGLVDMKFVTGELCNVKPEDLAKQINQLLRDIRIGIGIKDFTF